jgi:pimeloyl-ACP methyl ester carboxylesterase
MAKACEFTRTPGAAGVSLKRNIIIIGVFLIALIAGIGHAQVNQRVVDIPTRSGVTQRFVLLTPQQPGAAVVLFAGGHGGLQILPNGAFKWGEGNFLVRSRQLFAEQSLMAAVMDAPSDRQSSPYLNGFRQRREHVTDIKAVIAWLREQAKVPVWLVGTSRGTQSAAYAATQLKGPEGPEGIVLTSTILKDRGERPVPDMDLGKLKIPVLVVHHEYDGCGSCAFMDLPRLMERLRQLPRKELLAFKGGESLGNPCEPSAYHGFNGIEGEVVAKTAQWILKK